MHIKDQSQNFNNTYNPPRYLGSAFLGVTAFDVQAYPVVSLLFAITVLTYVGYYYLYKRQF